MKTLTLPKKAVRPSACASDTLDLNALGNYKDTLFNVVVQLNDSGYASSRDINNLADLYRFLCKLDDSFK